ncbi:MAG: ComEC/Rec2 family competence protein, partial [Syntrophaceae bacterium]|nr:ComEC/Rec2 family competence protein [Syntrophaceae bacterium]
MAHIPGSVTLPILLATLGTLLFLVATGRKGHVHVCLLLSLFLVGILNIHLYLHPFTGGDDITRHAGKGRLTVEGVICAPPRVKDDKTILVIETARIVQKGTALPVGGKILLSIKDSNNVFKYGNYIRVHTKLKEPRSFDNPGGFDYKKYLLYQGIRLRGYISRPSDIVIIRERAGNAFRTELERYRSLIRKRIREAVPSPEGDVLQALILGEKEGIPEDIIGNFNRTGVSHILAISGLHVGIIAFISLFIATALMKSSEYLLLRLNVFK